MKIYVDMDDVVVHLNVKIAEALGMTVDEMYAKWKPRCYTASEAFGVTSADIWKIAFKEKDFWGDLPEYPWAKLLWQTCNELAPTAFLSAPIYSVPELVPVCVSGKTRWMQRFTGNPKFEAYHLTRFKSDCARWDRILIDDREMNIKEFEAEGGVGILFPAIGNHLHAHREDPFNYILAELHEKVNKIKGHTASILDAEAEVSIKVNGVSMSVKQRLSYMEIVRLAYPTARDGAILSIIYSPPNNFDGPDKQARSVTPGQTINIEAGAGISCYDTSNA